jgi:hypothetical protein
MFEKMSEKLAQVTGVIVQAFFYLNVGHPQKKVESVL